jgi:hypothetical protein
LPIEVLAWNELSLALTIWHWLDIAPPRWVAWFWLKLARWMASRL